MVWNLNFQIAGLILTAVIFYFSYGQRRLKFRAEKAFLTVLLNSLLCNVLDILAVVAMNYKDVLGEGYVEIICEALLISIVSVACHSAWFSVAEIRTTFKRTPTYATILPVIVVFVTCCLFKTEIYINPAKGQLYFYGIPDKVAFSMCMLYVISDYIMVLIKRKNITKSHRLTIYSWLVIWSLSGAIQRINPNISVVGFAISLACLFIYTKLENPDRNIDSVTKIFNQRAFRTHIEEVLTLEKHKGLVSFSINNMSVITEIFGSGILNKLIREIGSFAQSFEDTKAFKLDDNVYSIVINKPDETEEILNKVISRFDEYWDINDVHINVNVSVSYIEDITIFKSRESVEEAVHFFALEGQKKPNEVIEINCDEIENRKKKIETQHALDWALRNNGVEVYYQPIYNIKKGYFTAMEALVRIKDQDGKLLFPGDFIEYAEKNGMILELGEQIFRNVCAFIRRTKIEQYGVEFIDVNLSVVQCMQEDLARTFKNIMGEYHIPPYRINLEITETAAIASKKTLESNMKELMDYGVSFSLDDYGSGYSNLSYIVGLPVSIIKIDRELTISYRTSDKAKIATESTVNMIHNLGMETIVEGVETETHYQDFKKLGVNLIQGYYFSKPIPKEEVVPFLTKWL